MKKRNWRTLLATIIMVLPFVLGIGLSSSIQASAAEGDATLNIHKKKMTSLPEGSPYQNTGGVMDDEGGVFAEYEVLPDVEFTVYDVTTQYYEKYKESKDQATSLDYVKGLDVSGLTPIKDGVDETDANGDVIFTVNKKSGDQDAVYLIVETPKNGVTVADNMVVAFPVYPMNADGSYTDTDTELSEINLYPKNVVTTDGALQVTKKGTAEGELLNDAEFVISRVVGGQIVDGQIVGGETQYISGANGGIYSWTTNLNAAQTFVTGNSYTVGGNAIILTTGSKGVLNVAGLEVGDYTLIETKAPDNAGMIDAQTETDFEVTKDTTTDAPVALEIKNDTSKVEKTTPKLDGKDVQIGQLIDYQISTNIPLGIANTVNPYTTFQLKDTHDAELTFTNKDFSLYMGETLIDPSNYDVNPAADGSSFVVSIHKEFIPQLTPGAQLVFNYQMYLNETAKPDQGYDNNAEVTTDNTTDQTDKPVTVITGGEKFIKKDADTDKALNGAIFVVRNGNNQYLTIDETTKAIDWVDSLDAAKKFTTIVDPDDKIVDGLIDIPGLEYGEYTLIETKAPNGYVTPEAPNNETPFTVAEGSYSDANEIEIVNKHKGSLPSTGGKGIVGFVAVGAVAIVGAGLYFMKGRKHIEG